MRLHESNITIMLHHANQTPPKWIGAYISVDRAIICKLVQTQDVEDCPTNAPMDGAW